MLVLVEMHTVHRAGSGDPPRIEEIATTLARDFFVSISEPNALCLCPLELRGNRALRLLDGRRRHHDDLRGRHPWLDGRSADRIHECRDALRRMPRVVRMHGLKVVRAQHEYHERQRRVDLDPLLKTYQAVATGLVRILEGRSSAVQTVFDHAHGQPTLEQLLFHDARPTICERKPLARVWNYPPRERIGVNEDLLHGLSS